MKKHNRHSMGITSVSLILLSLAMSSTQAQPQSNLKFGKESLPLGQPNSVTQFYLLQEKATDEMTKYLQALKLPDIFVKTEKFRWFGKNRKPIEIRYGNSEIGYFLSKNFRIEGDNIVLTLIPPSYKRPIEFQARWRENDQVKLSFLAKKQYPRPLNPIFEQFIQVEQTPSFPFVMLDWAWSSNFPIVVNRLGEVVWAKQIQSLVNKTDVTSFDILENGDFLFLRTDESSYLMQMSPFGEIKRQADFRSPSINLPNSHTVQYLKDSNEILFLSYACEPLPWWQASIPLFDGLMGWIRRMTLPSRAYRSGRLMQLSLTDWSSREIWNSYKTFSPDKNPSLASGHLAMADRFQDAVNEDQYRNFLEEKDFFTWCGWPNRYANADWTHENSAQYIKGKGYLVSVRNLNELIFLDEAGRLKWRLGEGPKDHDYYFAYNGQSFSMQHSARMLEDGRILLYDNHDPYRGSTGIRHGNQLMILNLKKPGLIEPEWVFPLPTPHSDVRGSTMPLRNGRIFAYTAGNPGLPQELMEIDPQKSMVTGHIKIHNYFTSKDIEARPFFGFAGDVFEETAPKSRQNEPRALSEKETRDLLEFSY